MTQGADWLLGLKGNQSARLEVVEDFFYVAEAGDFASVRHDFPEEVDKDHGRLERRRYWITEDLRTLPDTEQWRGLRSIGISVRARILLIAPIPETAEAGLERQLPG